MTFRRFLATTICCAALSLIIANNFFVTPAISKVTNIPEEVVVDGFRHHAVAVFLFGTDDERHRFAKGQQTEFGMMPYDSEAVMKKNYGMTDYEVHTTGAGLDFCKAPEEK